MNYLKISIKTLQYFLLLELVFVPIILFVIIINYNTDIKILEGSERDKLTLAARVASTVLKNIDSDLIYLSNSELLKNLMKEKSNSNIESLQLSFLHFSDAKGIYDQIRYLDSNGMEIVRVNNNNHNPYIVKSNELQNKKERYYFKDTYNLDSGKIFISPLDLNMEKGKIEEPFKPMLRIGTPVFDRSGNKQGIILINYLAINMLDDIRNLYITKHNEFLSSLSTSEVLSFSSPIKNMPLLLNSDGDYLIGEKSDDEWNFMLKHGVTIKDKCNEAWQIMTKNHSGQINTCEGLFTYTTIYPLKRGFTSSSGSSKPYSSSDIKVNYSDYSWKLTSYVKKQELKKMYNNSIKVAFVTILAISLILIIVSYILARNIYLKKEAQNDIKTLNGLLPICSTCKKIRNDEGYWDQLESYISDHSEADFSHGICPDCIKKYFPDLNINIEKK